MIAWLRGKLIDRDAQRAVLDVNGVGYEVNAPLRTVDAWAVAGDSVEAHISTQVREDSITLYGFESRTDRAAFDVLMSVTGVGPKLALACLDAATVSALTRAIETDDSLTLSRIPGVGKKTAQRLILELKGKMPATFQPLPTTPPRVAVATPDEDVFGAALSRLGYSRSEIDRVKVAFERDQIGESMPIAERLRRALQILYRSDS